MYLLLFIEQGKFSCAKVRKKKENKPYSNWSIHVSLNMGINLIDFKKGHD